MAPKLFGSPFKSLMLILAGTLQTACTALPGESDTVGLFFTSSLEYMILVSTVNFFSFAFAARDKFDRSNPELGMTPSLLRSEALNRRPRFSVPPVTESVFVQDLAVS